MIQFIAKTITPPPPTTTLVFLLFTNRRFPPTPSSTFFFLRHPSTPSTRSSIHSSVHKHCGLQSRLRSRGDYIFAFRLSEFVFPLTTMSFFFSFFFGGEAFFLLLRAGVGGLFTSSLVFITKLRGAINLLDDKNLFKFDFTRAERGYLTNLG